MKTWSSVTETFGFIFQLIENCVCLLRNLSYHVHHEIPGSERYQEAVPINQGPAPSSQKGGCFSSRKGKGLCLRDEYMCSQSAVTLYTCAHTTTYNACRKYSSPWMFPPFVAFIHEIKIYVIWLF